MGKKNCLLCIAANELWQRLHQSSNADCFWVAGCHVWRKAAKEKSLCVGVMSACVFKCLWGGWGAALYYGSWGGRGLKVRYFLIFQQSHSCGFGLRLPLNTVQLNKHRPLSCPHILHGWCDFSKSLCILFISPKGKSNEEDAANDKILNCRSTVEKKRTLIQCCSVFSKRKIQSLFDLACDTGCINAKKNKQKNFNSKRWRKDI